MNTNNHSYNIGHYGVCNVVEMDGKTMVFGTPEGLMEKYQEVYRKINNSSTSGSANVNTDKNSTDCKNVHVSSAVMDYFGNKSDAEIHKLLLKVLDIEPDNDHMEMTDEEFEDLYDASDCSTDVLLDYQNHLVFTGSDKELVKELIGDYTCDKETDWDSKISEMTANDIREDANGPHPTYIIMDEIDGNKMYWNIDDCVELSPTVVKKFLTEEESKKYTEYFEKLDLNTPDNEENNWEHSQYYVHLAGIRCAKGIVNGDIKCVFNTFMQEMED